MISNMKKNQEINKLSKIRLILASAISIFIFYHCIELIEDLTRVNEFEFSGGNQVNYSDFLLFILLFVGTILFALNRKVTDYISFSIFTFSFGGVLPFQFIDAGCLESPNFIVLRGFVAQMSISLNFNFRLRRQFCNYPAFPSVSSGLMPHT